MRDFSSTIRVQEKAELTKRERSRVVTDTA